jgi:hypothetical protein
MCRWAFSHIFLLLGGTPQKVSSVIINPSPPSARHVCFALAALLALMPPVPCRANEITHRRPIVLVLVHSSSQNDNAQLRALIIDSFRVELESHGIQVLPSDEPAADDRAIASLAKKHHADFALWGMYSQAGSEVQLNACWIDPVKNAGAGTASRTSVLNFSFDSVVESLVDEMMESQKKRFADMSLEQIEDGPQGPTAAQQPGAPRGAAVVSDGRPAVSPVGSAPKAEQWFAPFAFSLGSAPLMATFTALNYFPVGLDVSLTGLYRVRAPGGLFGFGLTSGLSGFHGKGAYTQADFFIIPIGIDILYGTRTGSAIDFFAHLAGGPAIFAVKPNLGEPRVAVIPYITGGVGISLSLFDSFGISLEGGYACFFDSLDPIMGFAPSLSVCIWL